MRTENSEMRPRRPAHSFRSTHHDFRWFASLLALSLAPSAPANPNPYWNKDTFVQMVAGNEVHITAGNLIRARAVSAGKELTSAQGPEPEAATWLKTSLAKNRISCFYKRGRKDLGQTDVRIRKGIHERAPGTDLEQRFARPQGPVLEQPAARAPRQRRFSCDLMAVPLEAEKP